MTAEHLYLIRLWVQLGIWLRLGWALHDMLSANICRLFVNEYLLGIIESRHRVTIRVWMMIFSLRRVQKCTGYLWSWWIGDVLLQNSPFSPLSAECNALIVWGNAMQLKAAVQCSLNLCKVHCIAAAFEQWLCSCFWAVVVAWWWCAMQYKLVKGALHCKTLAVQMLLSSGGGGALGAELH